MNGLGFLFALGNLLAGLFGSADVIIVGHRCSSNGGSWREGGQRAGLSDCMRRAVCKQGFTTAMAWVCAVEAGA